MSLVSPNNPTFEESQAWPAPPCDDAWRERVELVGRRVVIDLARRHYEAAHAAIDSLAREDKQAAAAAAEHRACPEAQAIAQFLHADDNGNGVRIGNKLEEAGIFTLGQLAAADPERLAAIPNFGRQAMARLAAVLSRTGFKREAARLAAYAAGMKAYPPGNPRPAAADYSI